MKITLTLKEDCKIRAHYKDAINCIIRLDQEREIYCFVITLPDNPPFRNQTATFPCNSWDLNIEK